MASKKQIATWEAQAEKINKNPEYIRAYVEYKQLAKQADQRLVRLEALSHDKHFHGVLEFSYKRAIRDAKSWGGDKRFNTAPPTTLTQLEAKIADIDTFLARPTSKKTTIIKIYEKKAKTDTEKYGAKFGVTFTWQEIANYYESEFSKNNDIMKGSKTEIRALAVLKKYNDEFEDDIKKKIDNIKEINERVQRVSKDKVVNKIVVELLKNGYDYDELMGDK